MPHRSRRALLGLLGAGAAALLGGCQIGSQTGTPSERSTSTASSAATARVTGPGTEKSSEVDCDTASRPGTAWPVPRRSPARDSYVADPEGFDDAPAVAWEAEPTAPDDSYATPLYGQPVGDSDDIYLTNQLDKGPERPMYGHVHALDAESSDRRWASRQFRSPSHPVVWGNLAVVFAETEDRNALVVTFDRTDGTRRWTREFTAQSSGFIAGDDRLYLALEESSDRGTIRALTDDGSTAWSRAAAFGHHVTEGPVVGADVVYIATREGRLHALDRSDGTTVWTSRFQDPEERRPFVTDLIATDCSAVTVVEGVVKAVDDGGSLRWELAGDHGQMATDGRRIYVGADLGDGTRELRAVDAETGEVRWTVGRTVASYEPPVVTADTVFVRFNESIRALDKTDGTERWRTDAAIDRLALVDGTLYGIDGGTLLALR